MQSYEQGHEALFKKMKTFRRASMRRASKISTSQPHQDVSNNMGKSMDRMFDLPLDEEQSKKCLVCARTFEKTDELFYCPQMHFYHTVCLRQKLDDDLKKVDPETSGDRCIACEGLE